MTQQQLHGAHEALPEDKVSAVTVAIVDPSALMAVMVMV